MVYLALILNGKENHYAHWFRLFKNSKKRLRIQIRLFRKDKESISGLNQDLFCKPGTNESESKIPINLWNLSFTFLNLSLKESF